MQAKLARSKRPSGARLDPAPVARSACQGPRSTCSGNSPGKKDRIVHKGYNLKVSEVDLNHYLQAGRQVHRKNTEAVGHALASLKDSTGQLVAAKIAADWFPVIRAEAFISHSHKDADLAVALAGFLDQKFRIRSFVDFTVWGHCEELLRTVDDEYCKRENGNTYDYSKRNRSTAHVYMMVSVALSKMINSCECVFFLNTPEAITGRDYVEGNSTESPWIYSEIAMTSLIQKRTPYDHRKGAFRTTAATEALQVNYQVDLSHLTELSMKDLEDWVRASPKSTGALALDALYRLK